MMAIVGNQRNFVFIELKHQCHKYIKELKCLFPQMNAIEDWALHLRRE